MNFESLKEDWNSEQEYNEPFSEKDLTLLKESHSFIDKVRKNMRLEFYLSIILALILGLGILLGSMSPIISPIKTSGCTITFILIFAVSLFYSRRFYIFYKTSSNMSFNTHDNLLWFYYEMKLNMEVYRSYAIMVLFLGILALAILNVAEPSPLLRSVKLTDPYALIILVCILLFCVVIFIASIEYWIRISYGRYVKRIKSILDELKGE
jgi:hypothetical protein